MNKPQSITLLLITAQRLVRADFAAGGVDALSGMKSTARDAGASLADAMREALALGGRAGARIWVIGEDLLCHAVPLAAAQVRGLSPDETLRALQFEIEPFSEIPPDETLMGYQAAPAVGGQVSYRVVACARAEVRRMVESARRAGGRLAGITHPETRSAPLPDAADEEALRAWLCDWGRALKTEPERVAHLRPPLAELTHRRLAGIAAALALLVLLLCATHGYIQSGRRQELRRGLAELRASFAEVLQVESENAVFRNRLAAIGPARLEREALGRTLAVRRTALSALLRAIAAARAPETALRAIREEGDWRMMIEGLSVAPQAADAFAARLAGLLRESAWHVQPLEQVAQGATENAGPWRFTLRVFMDDLPPIEGGGDVDGR